jgi:putative solute:sodium symporter small subunit
MAHASPGRFWRRNLSITAILLVVWLAATVVPVWWNDGPGAMIFGWPAAFWLTAYGAPLAYLIVIVLYAFLMNRQSDQAGQGHDD